MTKELTKERRGSPFLWYDFVVADRRYNESTKTANKARAEKIARAVRKRALAEAAARQLAGHQADIRFGDALREMREAKSAFKSAYQSDRPHRWLLERIGADTLISDIDDELLARLIRERRAMLVPNGNPPSNATVNHEVTIALAAVLNFVRRRVWMPREPAWKTHKLPTKPRRREMMIGEEMRLEDIRPDIWLYFLFMLLTGLRRKTALIRWGQVHWHEEVIHVTGKGDKPHEVLITPEVKEILLKAKAQQAEHADQTDHVFTWQATRSYMDNRKRRYVEKGKRYPATYHGVREAWVQICSKAGVTNLNIHDLRKTCGARIVRTTGDLLAASKILNHANIRDTAVAYSHITSNDMRDRHASVAAEYRKLRAKKVPTFQCEDLIEA